MNTRRLQVLYVSAVAAAAATLLGAVGARSVGEWSPAIIGFLLFACGLEFGQSKLPNGVSGSASFVVYAVAAALFGVLPAASIAFAVSAVSGLVRRSTPMKFVFNCVQHPLSVAIGYLAYSAIAGSAAGVLGSALPSVWSAVARESVAVVVMTSTYLTVNSLLVGGAVSISTRKGLLGVWLGNNRGIVTYDLSASALGLLMMVAYGYSEQVLGSGVPGAVLAAVPMLVARKTYVLFRQLQASSEEHLTLMVRAIEARDPYTSGHSLRVQQLSVALAKDLQVDSATLRDVEVASLLHDVGKIHEEFAPILRKEGKLSDDERALMETHAARGAEIVGVVSRFRGAVEAAVRHHHERWDGNGYPDRLAGERIPLISRIILVADTIDAMTTDRPYRARLTFEAVVSELRKYSGSQFDPAVAEIATTSLSVRRIIVGSDAGSRALPHPSVEAGSEAAGRSMKAK